MGRTRNGVNNTLDLLTINRSWLEKSCYLYRIWANWKRGESRPCNGTCFLDSRNKTKRAKMKGLPCTRGRESFPHLVADPEIELYRKCPVFLDVVRKQLERLDRKLFLKIFR